MIEFLKQPWPWYIAGPLIGLVVPALLLVGNKSFGLSSSLRHICAACMPAQLPFFQYDWKKEIWNLVLVVGISLGGAIAVTYLPNPHPTSLHPELGKELAQYGITAYSSGVPEDIINWKSLFTARGFLFMVVGGFLVGFGTRYAGGCTSGHAIMGLSNLQWPSFVATISFMTGGFIMTHLLLPFILSL